MTNTKRLAAKKLLQTLGAGVDLESEIVLGDDITGTGTEEPAPHRHVFLTGATGYLGAFLLHELLERTGAEVYCLVRAPNEAAGRDRIRRNLEQFLVWRDGYEARIHAVPGDLGKSLFGLTAERFDELGRTVDVIYHNGAVVNLVFPYSLLKPANVGGTREALRLAACHRVKPLHHVSTCGMFLSSVHAGNPVLEDALPPYDKSLRYGYMQSKWVADRLVALARERGMPVAMYRPTFIGWHTETGVYNDKDFVCGLLGGCFELGVFPEMDMVLDVVPVDYVSRAIVHLGTRPGSLGRVFHLCNPAPSPWADILAMLDAVGQEPPREPYAAWKARLNDARDSALYQQFDSMLPEANSDGGDSIARYLTGASFPKFDARNTLAGLAGSGVACEPLDAAQLEVYLGRLQAVRDGGAAPGPVQLWRPRS